MKHFSMICFALLALAYLPGREVAAQQKMSCVVGKSVIKVYSEPHERVVGRLKKGTKVFWEDEVGGDGTSWAKVSVFRNGRYVTQGWVVFGYGSLKCNWPR